MLAISTNPHPHRHGPNLRFDDGEKAPIEIAHRRRVRRRSAERNLRVGPAIEQSLRRRAGHMGKTEILQLPR
jgi:hypothetical protein